MRQRGRTCRAAADVVGCPKRGEGRKEGGPAAHAVDHVPPLCHYHTRACTKNQYQPPAPAAPRFCRRCHRRRFFRQSGQYHFPLGMVSRVRPTQAMWNHPMAQSWFSQPTISPYDTRLQ